MTGLREEDRYTTIDQGEDFNRELTGRQIVVFFVCIDQLTRDLVSSFDNAKLFESRFVFVDGTSDDAVPLP